MSSIYGLAQAIRHLHTPNVSPKCTLWLHAGVVLISLQASTQLLDHHHAGLKRNNLYSLRGVGRLGGVKEQVVYE